MNRLYLFAVLTIYVMGAWAQNNSGIINTSERWDFDKYIWSHTHSISSKNHKPILDFDAIDNWINLGGDQSISRDGKYFAYKVERGIWDHKKDDSLVVQSTTNSWRKSFAGARPGFFSGDSKQYIFQNKNDLCFLQTGGGQPLFIKDVASHQLPDNGKNEWLGYQLKNFEANLVLQNLITAKEKRFNGVLSFGFDNSGKWLAFQLSNDSKELVIYNLRTEKELHFKFVADYSFDASGEVLVLKTIGKIASGTQTALQYVNLAEEKLTTIWSTTDSTIHLSNYSLDGSGKQVVFTVQNSHAENALWYYRNTLDNAVLKVNNQSSGMVAGIMIEGKATFASNDRYIEFTVQPHTDPDLRLTSVNAVKVAVWDYRDSILQSAQPKLSKEQKIYAAIFSLESCKVILLENENEKRDWADSYGKEGDYVLIRRTDNNNTDRFWEKGYANISNWIVFLKDGSRRLLPTKATEGSFWFSPGGKYLVYFDAEQQGNYFSYELNTGKLANISFSRDVRQFGWEYPGYHPKKQPNQAAGVAGWLEGEEELLVYDKYDIWKLDLAGKKSPVNITNGYGRAHQIEVSLMSSDRGQGYNYPVLSAKDKLLLKAFNNQTKYQGFYRKSLGSPGNPELLHMGPYFYWSDNHQNVWDNGMHPIKAADANTWIVKRQTATETPNYFVTHDFKTYLPLTDLQPNKAYNWFTKEILTFKQLDGSTGKGLLCKPENFDPAKKYPVLVVFYENNSDDLFQTPAPQYIRSAITPLESPGWLVSHGYLVFIPEIQISPLTYGPTALNTVEGAARYLKQLPYVDGSRLGACSHSWSAKLGSYIFTHSKSFAATCISEGWTFANRINVALSINEEGKSELESAEVGFEFGNLWKNKSLWLDQTAVLNVDKVTSPLLLFCGLKSLPTRTEQTTQMFISLWRLEKKAWWLQYEKGAHNLEDIDELRDFTIRYTQFFDHYLKGAPAPRWMTEGLPYRLKGIEERNELDPAGSCGKNCKICKQWNEKYKTNPEMFLQPIEKWDLNNSENRKCKTGQIN